MQVTLPEQALPAKLTLNPELHMTDEEYYGFCTANAGLRFERTAQGEIIFVPPAGWESDYQCAEVVAQLRNWAKRDGRGSVARFLLGVESPDLSGFQRAAAEIPAGMPRIRR